MSSKGKRFAIGGRIEETTWYWTGRKLRPWTTMESGAKTWRTSSGAASYLPKAPMGPALDSIGVIEVQS
jgi:hypothetical protein